MPGRHRKSGLEHGFRSKAQWRLFAARPDLRAKYFKKIAHRTIRYKGKITGYRSLPGHVHGTGRATRRNKITRRGKRR